jgi:LEA14-like dessication related protein
MTGDDEDAINTADEDAIHITVAEEATEKKPAKRPVKKKPRRLWLLLAIIVIIIIIIVPIAATFQMPTVNVVGAEIRASGTGLQKTYKLYATVEVYNPNMVGCTIERISGTYYVNGANGGKFDEPNQVSIAAASTTTLDIQVIPTSPVPIHTTNTVEVKGTVTIQGAFTTWDVPFDETRDVPIT